MSQFQLFGRLSGLLDDNLVVAGSLEKPVNFTIDGVKYDSVFSIANSANTVIYNSDLDDFDILWIQSDFNVRLKLTDTASNTFALWLKGTGEDEKYGIPLALGLDETSSGETLNTIQAFNTSGNTAKIKIIAGT